MIPKLVKTDPGKWEYICNTCFEYINDCKCQCADKNSLGIDSNIIKSIQILHKKKYQTDGCCEGHVILKWTEKQGFYTVYFPLYISLNIASFEDFKKEFANNPEWQEKGFALIPVEKIPNRYQLVYAKGIKLKGDKFDEMISKKLEIIEQLNVLLNSLQIRTWGKNEKVIKTYY